VSPPEFIPIAKRVRDTDEAPKGKDIFYRCLRCGDVVPSQPTDNVGCSCGNVFIDIDAFRLLVDDFSQFEAVKKVSGRSRGAPRRA